ncbi:MAG: peptidylprolyl isomerase [Bacteriovoracaceae bacterium]|jgi:cyclophilin family peptidyl-prolyl cis-trans isomerase|nr:peptidylprolyl isomerase [Bacteriovoracaceae bacterium]
MKLIALFSLIFFANVFATEKVSFRTTKGIFEIKFFSKEAPKTVERIKELINKKFYNGLTFHRVIPGFVVQGGDPLGTGMGGSGKKLQAEFNSIKHTPGIVAMARAQDPNSADSQFYISLGTHPHLDNKYTIFAKVIKGMDVVKKIQKNDKMISVTLIK